jgi:putrescine aminotransferase
MSRRELLDRYERHHNPTLARLLDIARCPVEQAADGVTVVGEDGRRYLDFSAGYGVFGLGHRYPTVQAAAQRQLATLPGVPAGIAHPAADALIRALRDLLPGDLRHILLAGSGSEAMDIALRVALRARPERTRLVAAWHSYHGKTLGALGVMGQRPLRAPFEPLWPDTAFVPFGDADAVARAVGTGAVAVVLEPVLGGGYLAVAPDGYLAAVARICRRTGTLLIVDEVQTGFGRTGTMFAVQREGVVPDLMLLSKGMTGGHVPMAAVAVSEGVVTSLGPARWAQAREPASDICGSAFACAAATAAIAATVRLDLPRRAALHGERLLDGLRAVSARHPAWVLGVRGRGLMAGVELRSGIAEYAVWLRMLARGVLAGYSTNAYARRPVLRFFPPLIVEPADIDRALAALDDSLVELSRRPLILYDIANLALPLQYRIPRPVLRLVTRALLS